jgi:hypothetical protein
MTDITIYKPATVVVRREKNGNYTIVKPPWMTIQAINVYPPKEADSRRGTQQGWPVKKTRRNPTG